MSRTPRILVPKLTDRNVDAARYQAMLQENPGFARTNQSLQRIKELIRVDLQSSLELKLHSLSTRSFSTADNKIQDTLKKIHLELNLLEDLNRGRLTGNQSKALNARVRQIRRAVDHAEKSNGSARIPESILGDLDKLMGRIETISNREHLRFTPILKDVLVALPVALRQMAAGETVDLELLKKQARALANRAEHGLPRETRGLGKMLTDLEPGFRSLVKQSPDLIQIWTDLRRATKRNTDTAALLHADNVSTGMQEHLKAMKTFLPPLMETVRQGAPTDKRTEYQFQQINLALDYFQSNPKHAQTLAPSLELMEMTLTGLEPATTPLLERATALRNKLAPLILIDKAVVQTMKHSKAYGTLAERIGRLGATAKNNVVSLVGRPLADLVAYCSKTFPQKRLEAVSAINDAAAKYLSKLNPEQQNKPVVQEIRRRFNEAKGHVLVA